MTGLSHDGALTTPWENEALTSGSAMRLAAPAALLLSVALSVAVSAGGALSAESLPAPKPGTGYGAARAALIAKGFQPIPAANRRNDRCSAGRQDVCNAYPETVSCDGTGAAACRFIFASKKAGALTVVADGDDAGHLKVVTSRRAAKKDADWQRRGI